MSSLSFAGWCLGIAVVFLGLVAATARILRTVGYGSDLDRLADRLTRAQYYWRPVGTIWRHVPQKRVDD
jgi:hypothetical protein